MELRAGGDTFDRLFLAMSHWQLGEKEEARRWYGQAMEHIDDGKQLSMDFTPLDLLRFRADADKLMVQEKDSKAGDTTITTNQQRTDTKEVRIRSPRIRLIQDERGV
jgi:hypothetical protein